MKRVLRCRSIAVCLGGALLAAGAATAHQDSEIWNLGIAKAIPEAADWAQIPTTAPEIDRDLLFDDDFDAEFNPPIADPFESTNRAVLKFNRSVVDRYLLDPLTRGYRFVVPKPARRGVRRAFSNLNSPAILVNHLLQLRIKNAAETLGCFVLNSTLGVGGIFDVGEAAGLTVQRADFGQTLARAGVKSGPYLVVPIFGPKTIRSGVGGVVDALLQPLTYLVGPAPSLFIGGGQGTRDLRGQG